MKPKNIDGLQILRGLAALAVLIHHVLEESRARIVFSDAITRVGAAGVDIFFVLSGFLMLYTNSLQFGTAGAWRTFLLRRIVRIVPLYWLCTLIVVAAHASGKLYLHHQMKPWSVIGSLSFVENRNTVVGVGWTLNYEVYFYVAFALSLLLCRSAKLALPFVSSVILLNIVVIGQLIPSAYAYSDFLKNPIAIEFLFGMAVAYVFESAKGAAARRQGRKEVSGPFGGTPDTATVLREFFKKLQPSDTTTLLFTCLGVALIYWASVLANSSNTSGVGMNTRYFAWGLPAALVVFAAIFQANHLSWAGRCFLLIGDSSYALYLTHSIVMTIYAWALLHGKWKHAPMWVIIPAVLAFCVLLAIFVHKTIERPIHIFLTRAWFKTSQIRPKIELPAPVFQAAS